MRFSYIFSDFVDGHSEVIGIDHESERECLFQLRIYDSDLLKTNERFIDPVLLDLIDLGAAVYQADWLSFRDREFKRHIYIELPLRNAELFNNGEHKKMLQSLLFWYTSDRWIFKFTKRTNDLKCITQSPKLGLQVDTEVALWSGGLDSFAGLLKRYQRHSNASYTLVGSGSNDSMIGKQKELHKTLQDRLNVALKLIQLRISPKYPDGHFRTNDYFRSRGFVFKLLGTVVAVLEGQKKLFVYENGYGAINLPFQKSEIGIDHTRSIHPKSLEDMGQFVSSLLEMDFSYVNPFVLQTKSQMCEGLDAFSDVMWRTFSCDGPYRLPDQPRQCGHCSSCILRRVSLLNAFGEDQTGYLAVSAPSFLNAAHFQVLEVMKRQVFDLDQALIDESWFSLLDLYSDLRSCVKPISRSLGIPRDEVEKGLVRLYMQYLCDWKNVESELVSPFEGLTLA